MEQNQIRVKRIQTGTQTFFTIKNGTVYDAHGKNHVYCSCTGNTVKTATPMEYANGEVYCPNCHEKKVEVLQTYEEWKTQKEEEQRKLNEERLANLHIVEMGSDWECGFKFYGLSANIDYEDWLKIRQHFRYYRRGWSRNEELEWNYGEPTGWLTQNPIAVEEILVKEGLIKTENTMKAINEKAEREKQKKSRRTKKSKNQKRSNQRKNGCNR